VPKLKRAKKTQKNNLDHEIEVAALNESRGRDKGQQRQHFDGLPQRLQIIVFLQQLNRTMRFALGISNRFSVAFVGLGRRSPADLHNVRSIARRGVEPSRDIVLSEAALRERQLAEHCMRK
jgi:hypothetical protein